MNIEYRLDNMNEIWYKCMFLQLNLHITIFKNSPNVLYTYIIIHCYIWFCALFALIINNINDNI